MLSLEALTVRYGSTTALDAVDLTVSDSEIVCVLGPSGSGKSTLLRAIAGLEPPAGGCVRWDGDDLTRTAVHRRHFGLMFQDHALFPHRDVLGNVEFGLRMLRASRDEVRARACSALDRVGLSGFEHRRVRELSGGEQQRVALARALAPEPRLLMLDEPLGSLDRALRERLVVELRILLRSLRVTTIFVTHDQDEAFALADTVVLLRDGRVEQIGAPQEVWRQPRTEFAARFLGFSNVLDAVVEDSLLHGPWGTATAPADAPRGRVRLALRPEGLRLAADGAVQGVVANATFRRDHFLVLVDTGAGRLEVASATAPSPGERTCVEPDLGSAVVLPSSAGT